MVENKNISQQFFEPKRSSHWLFETEGLDSFLVKKITMPETTMLDGKLKALTRLEIEVYDAIAPCGSEEMIVVAHKASQPEGTLASVKLLDPIGTVVSMWELRIKLVRMHHGELDYSNSNPLVTKAFFDVLEMRLIY